jgi:hypothetical protein
MDTPTTKYPDLQKLFKQPAEYLTAENARELLAPFICPRCDSEETLGVFYEPNNGGTGIVCHCCGLKHPLRGVMWLPRDKHSKPKRSNDIAAVIKEAGNYCWGCGAGFEELRRRRIGRHVHHTRPFAKYGEGYPKIPMCTLCHELISAVQRHRQVRNPENEND